ncbi:MAG: hypothetical protein E7465_04260 [Ruminococcaceae bacterium]|nr:hypothetical protein [Oscillospiraceae bacterium]
MRLSKYFAAGLSCVLLATTVLSGCAVSEPPAPETTSPTVAATEAYDETRIRKDAHNGSEIQQFRLSDVVEYIDEGAFANCHELKKFHCSSRDVNFHENAFSGTENVVFYCYLDSTADHFARAQGYERVYYDAFSVQCDTVNNGCVGLPITWSAVDVMPGQTIDSQFVYTVNFNDEPVFTSEPTPEDSFVYTPAEGGVYSLTVDLINELTQQTITTEAVPVAEKLTLGHYEQDDDATDTEPIEWRILTVEDGKAFVLSEHILTRGSYFNPEWIKYKYTYWSHSCVAATSYTNYWGSAPESPDRLMGGLTPESVPLSWKGERGPETDLYYLHARHWCNEVFYKDCFTDEEKDRIVLSNLINHNNPMYGTIGGPDTQDYVFFLSYDELKTYLPTDADRIATFTTYAGNLPVEYGGRDAYYWLRTPGIFRINAMYVVADYGAATFYGSDVGHNMVGYRPAMWITVGG